MKTLKRFIKFFLLDSALMMIVLTLSLYTYPSNLLANEQCLVFGPGGECQSANEEDVEQSRSTDRAVEEINRDAEAAEAEEEKPEVYKPGEEFNDALTKANESPESEGIVGMVEQFFGIAFAAAAISSLIFQHTPRSLIDCPQNQNANITLRLMQAAALVYLLGELKAKSEFKKAAKLATDATFAPQAKANESVDDPDASAQAREKNNKQIEAFDTLAKVYQHKIDGIEAKKNLATIAELALLGALGIEIGMTMGHKAMCLTNQEINGVAQIKISGELAAVLTATETAFAAYTKACSPTTAPACAQAAACKAAIPLLTAVITNETTTETTQKTAEVAETVKEEGKSLLENTNFLLGIGAILAIFTMTSDAKKIEKKKQMYSDYNPLKYSNEAYEISRTLWRNIFTPFPEALAEGGGQMFMMAGMAFMMLEGQIGQDTAEGTVNDTATTASISTEQSVWTAAQAAATCTAATPVEALNAENMASELAPIHCCGANVTGSITNGFTMTIPNPSVMDTKVDIFIKPLPLVGSNNFEFVKPAILNTIEQIYLAKHHKNLHKKDPVVAMGELKAFYQVMESLEENFESEIQNSKEIQEFDRKLAKWEQDENFDYLSKIDELKVDIISDAHAMDFGELLGFGFKLFMAIKLLKGFLRNTALPKPRNRMWTFGAVAAINALIISFAGKKLSENKKQLEVVKAERDKFARSSAVQTGIDEATEESSSTNRNDLADGGSSDGGQRIGANFGAGGAVTCASGSPTTGFSPSPCNEVQDQGDITGLTEAAAAAERQRRSTGASLPLSFAGVPAIISSATNAAATGGDRSNPRNFNNLLDQAGRQTAAVKKDLDEAIKKFDETLPKSITTPDGKTKNIPGLGATLAALQTKLKGTPISGGNGGLLDGSELSKETEKSLASKAKVNIPKYKPAKAKKFNFQKANVGSLDFGSADDEKAASLDDMIEENPEENLQDFKVDAGDIIDKPEVSIFKIINVRYFKSYDILFNKKKTQVEEKEAKE